MQKKHKENTFKESIENAQTLLNEAIELFGEESYKKAIEKLSLAHKIFLAYKDISNVSVCLSLNGLIKYIKKNRKLL